MPNIKKTLLCRNFQFTLTQTLSYCIVIILGVFLTLPNKANANQCLVERTTNGDVGSFRNQTQVTFNDLEIITEIKEYIPCSSFFCSIFTSCSDNSFGISGNTIQIAQNCIAEITVEGIESGCELDEVYEDIAIASSPLNVTTSAAPNILLLLDNSNTMVENVMGTVAAECQPGPNASCIAGAASPLSKSEIIRGVGRRLLDKYLGQVNLGLMAYQQNPAGTSGWDDNVILADIVNRYYDVSYDPEDFDPSFSGSPWDSQKKRFQIDNPSDPDGVINYNIGVPGYTTGSGEEAYFWNYESGSSYKNAPFRFYCYRRKTGTSNNGYGYSSYCGSTSGLLNDSARARGVTNWGKQMVALPFNTQEWVSISSPGLGYLHTPIKPLDEEQRERLQKKLAPQHQNYASNLLTDPDDPVIAAGLTPLEGTLLTARDYFKNQSSYFGTRQGRGNAEYPLPESCGVNTLIWLTDGMPSVDKEGNALGEDTDTALNEAIAAAEELHSADVDAYVVGFAMPPTVDPNSLERLASAGGTNRAYFAQQPQELDAALERIFDNIISSTRETATAVAVASSFLQDGSRAYLSAFRSEDWSGELQSYSLNSDASYGELVWDAEAKLRSTNPDNRNIFSSSDEGPISLVFENLSEIQQEALDRNWQDQQDDLGTARINWLRGSDHDQLRNRSHPGGRRLLGDIVHSTPIIATQRYQGYSSLPGDEGNDYLGFIKSLSERPDMLYVGANDGMLHAFDTEDGEELFAYMPSELLAPEQPGGPARISALMEPDYSHRFLLDGETTVGDAYLENGWRTIALGSMGAGGRTVFALDVTDPEGFTDSDVLWEFTHEDLGRGVSRPSIARLSDGTWAAIFGNGYNAGDRTAKLFVVNLESGDLINLIETEEVGSDGLATPTVTDWPNLDLNASRAYAGDLQGNMWRFDLSSENPENWSANKLFQAVRNGTSQPITARPLLAPNPGQQGEIVVMFGTGSYFRVEDAVGGSASQIQSLYAVHDTTPGQSVGGRGQLEEQTIEWEGSVSVTLDGGGTQSYNAREVSRNIVNDSQQGWYLDLAYSTPEGERVISTPTLSGSGKKVRFASMLPNDDPCLPGREGWLNVLDIHPDGSNPAPVFDLNRDGYVDDRDNPMKGDDTIVIDSVAWGDGTQAPSVSNAEGQQSILSNDPAGEPLGIVPDRGSIGRLSWEER
ncbi:pilus assembly protein [Halomonas alimentaria]|uniref:VWFA domain-containing protein n=1 Tax=Halomonas alimentaria TaxID=147248 RepID=A0A7X4W2Y7_9GAMM|nr:PilC/PilY family type IV pilus protein [Halomonas alimentaria]NAW33270.1 hypothetical protein [Halomonas alimentaria]